MSGMCVGFINTGVPYYENRESLSGFFSLLNPYQLEVFRYLTD